MPHSSTTQTASTALARMSHGLILLVALGAALSPATAQDPRLRPGATIRFGPSGTDTVYVGQLARATPDSILLRRCTNCSRLSYSRIDVNRLAVFQPAHRGSRFLTGFGYGGLAGLGLGVILAKSCHGIGDECDGGIVLIPFGGLLGGLIGGLIGYLTAYTWDPVP